jgi:hypothetical protein
MDWYDASGLEKDTAVVFKNAANLASSKIVGPFQLSWAMHAAGWMTPIPKSWQESLGGIYISGFSSGGILSRLSVGLSGFILSDIDSLINSDIGSVIQNKVLLDFTYPKNILYYKSVYDEDDVLKIYFLYNTDYKINYGQETLGRRMALLYLKVIPM